MTSDAVTQKRKLRTQIRTRRLDMTQTERDRAEYAITRGIIGLVGGLGAKSVAAYLSRPSEPSTRGFLDWALDKGLPVLLPVSRPDRRLDWAPYDGRDEVTDQAGMPAPATAALGPGALDDVDLILVPAAAIDHSGARMGWGGGYYDRALESVPEQTAVYAVVFDPEFLTEVPVESHDRPVDGVVTPSRVLPLPLN